MEKERKPGSRRLPTCSPDLSQRPVTLKGAGSLLSLCYLLILLAALPVSCDKTPAPDPPSGEELPPAVADSALTRVTLSAGKQNVYTLDLFVYDGGGTQPLEKHLLYDRMPDSLSFLTTVGEKILVGIANSPRRFNLAALGRFDTMQKLAFSFADDNPASPILGGTVTTVGQAGGIVLTGLLCRIVLKTVTNTMDGYELLEEPRVRLIDLPDNAEILREKDFRPTELLDAGAWTELPCDVGFFPQEPGTTLWCYPNDTPEDVLGVPRPSLEFECRIAGQTCTFDVPLPPLPRGCSKEVELTVDGPDSYTYRVR
jgi:hypothetical protein